MLSDLARGLAGLAKAYLKVFPRRENFRNPYVQNETLFLVKQCKIFQWNKLIN